MTTSRIREFDPKQLSNAGQAVHDRILQQRGYLPGPYRFWLESPGFADTIEPLEAYLRERSSLAGSVIETLVLTTANHWRTRYVWTAHVPPALQSGLKQGNIDAILTGQTADWIKHEDAVCHTLCTTLLDGSDTPNDVWTRAMACFGEAGVNELLGLLGLYTSVCLTMNAYRMPTKHGEPDPFEV